jgi:hypothetical protein
MRVETKLPEAEETLGASSLEPRFPREDISPREDDAKLVTLKKDSKYRLVTFDISFKVIIDEDMLGKVSQLKYADHDITYTMKFLELAWRKLFELKIYPVTNHIVLVPKVWAKGLM